MGAVHLGDRRAVLFAMFGCGSLVVPILEGVWEHGASVQAELGLLFVALTAFFNGIGMGAYIAKVRCAPNRYKVFCKEYGKANHERLT